MSTLSSFLQIAGLTVVPFALLVGLTAQHGMLAELYILGVGAGLFILGRLIARKPPE